MWLTQPNTYSWRPVQDPLRVPTSKQRGIRARLNLLGCVDFASGEVLYREVETNTSGTDIVAFLERLAQDADPNCPTAVVCDRASVHTCALVAAERAQWKARGLILTFLPAYSPELNLMEGRWLHLKYHLLPKRAYEDKAQLRAAVNKSGWGQAV